MALPQEKTVFSPQEYLDWEAQQPDKHEYVAGEVFAMVGARRVHVAIAGNLAAALKAHLRGTPYRAFTAGMKLHVAAANAFYYPDVLVTCDARDLAAERFMENPAVLIEVLSESTEAFDRGEKFETYKLIPTLREYLLVPTAGR